QLDLACLRSRSVSMPMKSPAGYPKVADRNAKACTALREGAFRLRPSCDGPRCDDRRLRPPATGSDPNADRTASLPLVEGVPDDQKADDTHDADKEKDHDHAHANALLIYGLTPPPL
ncbi:hypothetical protein ABTJ98_19695, partial [Acinetobacter baumannii]